MSHTDLLILLGVTLILRLGYKLIQFNKKSSARRKRRLQRLKAKFK